MVLPGIAAARLESEAFAMKTGPCLVSLLLVVAVIEFVDFRFAEVPDQDFTLRFRDRRRLRETTLSPRESLLDASASGGPPSEDQRSPSARSVPRTFTPH